MVLLLQDSFDRLDNTSLGQTDGAGTLDPQTWQEGPGSAKCQIEFNRLRARLTTSFMGYTLAAVAFLDAGTPDIDITIDGFSGNTSSGSGVLFRYVDDANTWTFRTNGGDDNWLLQRRRLGTTVLIASGSVTSINTLRLKTSGSRITGYANGTQVVDIYDPELMTSELHGCYVGNSAGNNAECLAFALSEGVSPLPILTTLGTSEGSIFGGETVVILGHNFTGATAVDFGATSATSFTVISESRIQAVAPPHAAGVVGVSVTTPNGASGTINYTYAVAPPFVASVSPNNSLAGGGVSVTILGSGFTGTTAVKFGTTDATSFTVVDDSEITAVNPAHTAGTVVVKVITPAGSSS